MLSPDGPSNHEGPYQREEEGQGGRRCTTEAGAKQGPKPRGVGVFQKLEKTRDWVLL